MSPSGDLRSTESVANLTGSLSVCDFSLEATSPNIKHPYLRVWPLPWFNCMTLVSLPRTFLSSQSVGGMTEFLLNVKTNIFSWFFVPLGPQTVFANENAVYYVYEHKGTTAREKKDEHPLSTHCLQRHCGVTR